jgi:hypothetical protein
MGCSEQLEDGALSIGEFSFFFGEITIVEGEVAGKFIFLVRAS